MTWPHLTASPQDNLPLKPAPGASQAPSSITIGVMNLPARQFRPQWTVDGPRECPCAFWVLSMLPRCIPTAAWQNDPPLHEAHQGRHLMCGRRGLLQVLSTGLCGSQSLEHRHHLEHLGTCSVGTGKSIHAFCLVSRAGVQELSLQFFTFIYLLGVSVRLR